MTSVGHDAAKPPDMRSQPCRPLGHVPCLWPLASGHSLAAQTLPSSTLWVCWGHWRWAPDPVFLPHSGHANASFCPHGYGCRTLVVCEGQALLDVTHSELTVTVRVPEGRWLWLVSPSWCPAQGPAVLILVIPLWFTWAGSVLGLLRPSLVASKAAPAFGDLLIHLVRLQRGPGPCTLQPAGQGGLPGGGGASRKEREEEGVTSRDVGDTRRSHQCCCVLTPPKLLCGLEWPPLSSQGPGLGCAAAARTLSCLQDPGPSQPLGASPLQALGPRESDQASPPRIMSSWSLRTSTALATSGRSPWTNPMTSSATAQPRATTSGGLGSGRSGVQGGGLGRQPASPLAPPCSPSSSSLFCRNAAASLSLFYNNGARPCGCHEVGATGPTCEPFGGQCPCRAHVIGRDCSRCATGYWGFPNCRREYPSPWVPSGEELVLEPKGDGSTRKQGTEVRRML